MSHGSGGNVAIVRTLGALAFLLHPCWCQCINSILQRFPGWPKQLDASIYWFNKSDVPVKAGTSDDRQHNYDPNKPTVIFFPGWTGHLGKKWALSKGHKSSVEECTRISTLCSEETCPTGITGNFLDSWFDRGWNVGFFYWDQFADEVCMRDAEQKIWFDRGGKGLRWKSFDPTTGVSSYEILREENIESVTDFCVGRVTEALHDFAGKELRFVGFDIGAQLATRCAALLHFRRRESHGLLKKLIGGPQTPVPTRLTLLEPYFSEHHFHMTCKEGDHIRFTSEQGLGDYTAAATASTVAALHDKFSVITEVYKSSVLTQQPIFGVVNEGLTAVATSVVYDSGSCGGVGFFNFKENGLVHVRCRHFAVVPFYFMSFGSKSPAIGPPLPPTLVSPDSALGACPTPSASCSDGQIRQWIQRNQALGGMQIWRQTSGAGTADTSDDIFALWPSASEAAQAGNSSANKLVYMTPPRIKPDKAPLPLIWKIVAGSVAVLLLVAILMLTGICKVGVADDNRTATLEEEEEDEEEEDEEKEDDSSNVDPKLQGV